MRGQLQVLSIRLKSDAERSVLSNPKYMYKEILIALPTKPNLQGSNNACLHTTTQIGRPIVIKLAAEGRSRFANQT